MANAQAILPPEPKKDAPPVTAASLEEAKRKASSGGKNDPGSAYAYAKLLLEAAGNSTLASQSGKLDAKQTRKNVDKWTSTAQKSIKKLATQSKPYPEAMFFLGTCYGGANPRMQVETNREKEYEFYRKASKLGHAQASYRAGQCQENGSGVKKDENKALAFYKLAAQQGDSGAMYKIGRVLLKGGMGQAQSTSDALIWLRRAADADHPEALYELARLHETADGSNAFLARDEKLALELYSKAAAQGQLAAQYRMGAAHEYGHLGAEADARRSVGWYSRAAQKGDSEAELGLSGWYLTGAEGVLPKSETESYLWARRASEKGLAKAQYAVGYFAENGIGTPANMTEAVKWYKKAAGKKRIFLQEVDKKLMIRIGQKYAKAVNRLRDLGQ
ncbi:uncharacterized protein V2V93DRAFT_325565 [Kockiozyma suomiensis]|uniref:uncharacterized protein n=1 Tax=Kockiozyma suomiensis TaxID=1337062 RepID=UPI003343209B